MIDSRAQRFLARKQTQKGILGESIVLNYLRSKDCLIYKEVGDVVHFFDFIVYPPNKQPFYAEVKTKSRLNKYNAYGLDGYMLEGYLKHNNNPFPLYFFIIDEMLLKVFFVSLDKLMEPTFIEDEQMNYPNYKLCEKHKMVIFSAKNMKCLFELTKEQAESIKSLNMRTYEYKIDEQSKVDFFN